MNIYIFLIRILIFNSIKDYVKTIINFYLFKLLQKLLYYYIFSMKKK